MHLLKTALCALVLAVAIALAAFAGGPAGIEGTWVGTAILPDQTPDEVTLIIEKAEKGYKGKVSDAAGVLAPETPLTEIVYDGKELKVVFPTAEGVVISIVLKPDKEKFTGQWTSDDGGSGAVEIAKKK